MRAALSTNPFSMSSSSGKSHSLSLELYTRGSLLDQWNRTKPNLFPRFEVGPKSTGIKSVRDRSDTIKAAKFFSDIFDPNDHRWFKTRIADNAARRGQTPVKPVEQFLHDHATAGELIYRLFN